MPKGTTVCQVNINNFRMNNFLKYLDWQCCHTPAERSCVSHAAALPGLGEKANDSLDMMFDATAHGEYKSYNNSHLGQSQLSGGGDQEGEDGDGDDGRLYRLSLSDCHRQYFWVWHWIFVVEFNLCSCPHVNLKILMKTRWAKVTGTKRGKKHASVGSFSLTFLEGICVVFWDILCRRIKQKSLQFYKPSILLQSKCSPFWIRRPTFAHMAVIRKKDERQKLKATTCKECEIVSIIVIKPRNVTCFIADPVFNYVHF